MAYDNVINLVTKFLPVLDDLYQQNAKTAILEAPQDQVLFDGADKVKLFKLSMDGMGDYSRNKGYPTGSVKGEWEEHALKYDRGRSFMVDRLDDEETLFLTFGNLFGEFWRTKMIPEVDAVRFADLAGTTGITTASADITVGTSDVPALIATAIQAMNDDEVAEEGRILFVSNTLYAALQAKITRQIMNGENGINSAIDMYEDMRVVKVPKRRFNTAVNLLNGVSAGEEAGGFTVPASTSYPINFMIVEPSAARAVTKHISGNIFSPDVNQTADAWKLNMRMKHGIFVPDNKVKGIYMHRAATANT